MINKWIKIDFNSSGSGLEFPPFNWYFNTASAARSFNFQSIKEKFVNFTWEIFCNQIKIQINYVLNDMYNNSSFCFPIICICNYLKTNLD